MRHRAPHHLQTYRLAIAYDGRAFAGFARQPGRRTVEGMLRAALGRVAPDITAFAVAGRTDRGASASGQVVSFRARAGDLKPALMQAVDEAAPGELACLEVRAVPRGFHAKFSARSRTYVYITNATDSRVESDRVDRLVNALVGTRCFSAFARDTPPGASTVRTLLRAQARAIRVEGRDALRFDFTATSFLRRQVRVMVSTSIREALAGATDERLAELAAVGERSRTAPPAHSFGLTLTGVGY